MKTRIDALLEAALICLDDGCPAESCMQLCRIQEDACEGDCHRCWLNYLIWLRNGCGCDPYRLDRIKELVG